MPTWPTQIALYGPPGAGKTSLINVARSRGFPAQDLESEGNTYTTRTRALKDLAADTPHTLFGAADATPEDFPAGTHFVLLAPSPEELIRRVRARGDQRSHKWVDHALQVRTEHLAMAAQGIFNLVIQDDGPPDHILDLILASLADPQE